MSPRIRSIHFVTLFLLIMLVGCASGSNISPSSATNTSMKEIANVIAGSANNQASANVQGATISGGGQIGFPNQVNRNFGTVSGGRGNQAGEYAVVGGGNDNTASGFRSVISGGSNNVASTINATVGGGTNNTASDYHATVSGGSFNTASNLDATVGGGSGNVANFRRTTIAGGTENTASNEEATVGGGSYNTASGAYSTAGGGTSNTASGFSSTVSGGAGNRASNDQSTVSGGLANRAEGMYSTVPGGFANQALADYSFATGSQAQVDPSHMGATLFADASRFPFVSLTPNEFAVRATGGVRFVTGLNQAGEPLSGVRLPPGSGSWEMLSDRNAKTDFIPVDSLQVLERLASLPISTWNYKGQPASVQHMGPVAQDFYAAFGLGSDNHYISSVDSDGVALAAIQGLYRMTREKDTQLASLQEENDKQAAQLSALDARLTALEHAAGTKNASDSTGTWLAILGVGFVSGLLLGRRSRPQA